MKPVRLLCYMFLLGFWPWPCTTFNSIPIILNLLTNRNIAFIYSVTIYEQKIKDCARSGNFQHKLQHRCFQLWCLPAFITSRLYKLWSEKTVDISRSHQRFLRQMTSEERAQKFHTDDVSLPRSW